ncbi:V-type ATPase subunit [Lachnospiraceae bacterium MD1]|uniref:V-type ATPase subunit n=1 Tax=Variimorphobacter saccharofermentans TaxID=2755051 RepID=A0A839K0M0_9FIRM|nr:V-type ATPase subunit [Variimorphobacter saccharofermentans]MBB2183166.1 V-type ATPase subunit [Variimorphobacter saccharofermentans]
MADNQYLYAVARIRSKEISLLNKSDIEQLMNCKSEKECLNLLKGKGWGASGEENAEQMLSIEREKTWDIIGELVEDLSVFDTFLYSNDFHNLKAAIKQVYTNSNFTDIYISQGTIDVKIILNAVKEHNFSLLPEHMRSCAEEAYQVQMHTGDSQLCDVIIDRTALETILRKGKETNNELLAEYAELKVAVANINIAIRSVKTGKDTGFMDRAIAECDSLNKKELITAAQEGIEAVYQYLSNTVYAEAVSALKESPSAFERWCDNVIIRHIIPQKYNPFSISPLAAYILARENEIKVVRILLSGKRNEIADSSIRERLREMYV